MDQVAKRRRINGEEELKPEYHCLELSSGKMKGSESGAKEKKKATKPQFVPAKDDSKPVLQDPILRSDPIETEEALLRLPPFSLFSERQQKA